MNALKKGLFVFLFILMNCRTPKPTIEIGGYAFNYRNLTYRIESVTPSHLEGYNILSQIENEKIILKAIDKEQNGLLNEVLIGKMSLDEANFIYNIGIKEGERLGYIKKRTFAREYRTFDTMNNYLLATYLLVIGDTYNKFRVISRQILSGESVLIDLNADGELDQIEKGNKSLKHYQKLYTEVLEKGMKEFKIEKKDGSYIVVM